MAAPVNTNVYLHRDLDLATEPQSLLFRTHDYKVTVLLILKTLMFTKSRQCCIKI